ncbi:MAG: DsbA family oxidoreductase [Nitrospira sp.]|nr:DsbA family oxidoreductase [Nitrospira sp.]
MNERALTVDVYSDVICPWCYVGKRRLERALQQVGATVKTRVVWKPFQLNPTMPQQGMDRRQYLDAKFGGPEAAQSIYDQVAAAGAAERIPFAFDRIARTPNTFSAHRLIWLAGRQGKQDALVEALFHRYFVEGGDIGSIETLSLAAAQAGLDRAAVETFLAGDEGVETVKAEEVAGHRLGIRGVPYFVINGAHALSGAQPPEQFLAVFRQINAGSVVGKAGG